MEFNRFPNDATGDALNWFQQNRFDLSKPLEIDVLWQYLLKI